VAVSAEAPGQTVITVRTIQAKIFIDFISFA
jgi:uncharacterized protein (DUF2164 family)